MRKITFGPVLTFAAMAGFAMLAALLLVETVVRTSGFVPEHGVLWGLAVLSTSFAGVVAACRAYLLIFPLKPGDIPPGSTREFHYHVYLLFY